MRTIANAVPVLYLFYVPSISDLSSPIKVLDIGIVVATSGGKYEERVLQARDTWAHGYQVLFVGDAVLPDVVPVPCESDIGRGLCCKKLEGLRLAIERFPSAKWLASVVDDTYVFVEQLSRELGVFNSQEHVYVGAASVLVACDVAGLQSGCGEAHAGGGGGFALSRSLAMALMQHSDVFMQNCHHDDLHFGHFFRYAFDVHVHSLPGILQEPRLRGVTPRFGEAIPGCTLPLPPAVFSRNDYAGPLRPLAPLDATRLAMIHSDPSVWQLLLTITRLQEELVDSADAMLAFIDVGGRIIVGPRYEERHTLSLCLYPKHARLATFNLASTGLQDKIGGTWHSNTLRWAKEKGYGAEVRELCKDGGCLVQESFWTTGVGDDLSNGSVVEVYDELRANVRIWRQNAR